MKRETKVRINRILLFWGVLIVIAYLILHIITVNIEDAKRKFIKLYFFDRNYNKLLVERQEVPANIAGMEKINFILQSFLAGTSNFSKYRNVVSPYTKLLGSWIRNGVLYVWLSNDFIKYVPSKKNKEKMIIKAVLRTLFDNIWDIDGVRFIVFRKLFSPDISNNLIRTFNGFIDLNRVYYRFETNKL